MQPDGASKAVIKCSPLVSSRTVFLQTLTLVLHDLLSLVSCNAVMGEVFSAVQKLLVRCRNVFLYKWKGLAVFDKYVVHPPLPPKLSPCLLWVTLYTDTEKKTKQKNSFIEACEGRHVHKSPLRSSIYCVVLIVYYSPCTAVFLQIWFTVSLIL